MFAICVLFHSFLTRLYVVKIIEEEERGFAYITRWESNQGFSYPRTFFTPPRQKEHIFTETHSPPPSLIKIDNSSCTRASAEAATACSSV
jgi:hypothetical protein